MKKVVAAVTLVGPMVTGFRFPGITSSCRGRGVHVRMSENEGRAATVGTPM